jgi:hypothetical protein
MITSSHSLFDTTILVQPGALQAPFSTREKIAPQFKASPVPEIPASLWRQTFNECEASHRHSLVVRSVFGVFGLLSIGSVAVAACQVHALFSGDCFQNAISAFLP